MEILIYKAKLFLEAMSLVIIFTYQVSKNDEKFGFITEFEFLAIGPKIGCGYF
jgi:hypothetical protein